MNENIVALIPIRAASKSILLKNIKMIAGKPLVYWVIEAAIGSKYIKKIFISTDFQEIKDCIKKINNKKIEVINRSPGTAAYTAISELALLEFCKNYQFKHVFFIQATSPLLRSKDIDMAWEKYKNQGCDSILSVVRQKRFIWKVNTNAFDDPQNYDLINRPRRQDFDGFLVALKLEALGILGQILKKYME